MRTWYLDIQGEHVLVHTHTYLNMYYRTSIFFLYAVLKRILEIVKERMLKLHYLAKSLIPN